MTRCKAVRTDRELECPDIDAGLRAAGCELLLLPEGIGENELIAAVHDADLLLMCYTPITARVIAAAERLKGIVKYGVGIDAIEISAAMARGISVVNVPEYAEETVAEGAFALMIALARKLMAIGREMATKAGRGQRRSGWGSILAAARSGWSARVRSGAHGAHGAGFRMRVIGYDPHVSADVMRAGGIEKIADLHALLAASDIVSIHAVLNDQTRHLIGGLELGLMKPSAFLIDVSRGAIVDEAALVVALGEKVIAGAALDVFSQEPLTQDGHPMSALHGQDNVILFLHLTFYNEEAMARLTWDTLARSREILEGRPVLVKSHDPRLRAQRKGVMFGA